MLCWDWDLLLNLGMEMGGSSYLLNEPHGRSTLEEGGKPNTDPHFGVSVQNMEDRCTRTPGLLHLAQRTRPTEKPLRDSQGHRWDRKVCCSKACRLMLNL